jgi:hypothetical protein
MLVPLFRSQKEGTRVPNTRLDPLLSLSLIFLGTSTQETMAEDKKSVVYHEDMILASKVNIH